MADGENQPVIIKKKVQGGGGGHHGGAWKIAYADFVTAMMAFFLVLWLLNSVTEKKLNGIADYFSPPNVSKSTSGAGGVLGGRALDDEGNRLGKGGKKIENPSPPAKPGSNVTEKKVQGGVSADKDTEKTAAKKEQKKFNKAKKVLKQALQSSPELQKLSKNMLVQNTKEGLRIQLVDHKGTAMFPSGSARMKGHTKKLMRMVSAVAKRMPNEIAISGHTDAVPFAGARKGYGNWELSTDRALAARRALIQNGVPQDRVKRVVGKASTDPLKPDNPKAPENRRISITMLRKGGMKQGVKPGPLPENF